MTDAKEPRPKAGLLRFTTPASPRQEETLLPEKWPDTQMAYLASRGFSAVTDPLDEMQTAPLAVPGTLMPCPQTFAPKFVQRSDESWGRKTGSRGEKCRVRQSSD